MKAEPVSEVERLTRKFRPALLAFFARRVSSHAEAEDLTQEVFIQLMQAEIAAVEVMEAYVFRIATNLLRDRARRTKVRNTYHASVEQDERRSIDIFDPFRITAARETIGVLWAAVQALPEPTRQIFILYRIEDLHKQTIADNFGYSVRTVEKHISHALVFLARRVGNRQ